MCTECCSLGAFCNSSGLSWRLCNRNKGVGMEIPDRWSGRPARDLIFPTSAGYLWELCLASAWACGHGSRCWAGLCGRIFLYFLMATSVESPIKVFSVSESRLVEALSALKKMCQSCSFNQRSVSRFLVTHLTDSVVLLAGRSPSFCSKCLQTMDESPSENCALSTF